MTSDSQTVRAIAWKELFPCLLLARVFRIAIGVLPLAFATLGVLLIPAGWWAASRVFLSAEDRSTITDYGREIAALSQWADERSIELHEGAPPMSLWDAASRGLHAPHHLVSPFRLLLGEERLNFRQNVCLLAGLLWVLSVWSFFGAAIARIAAVKLAADQPTSLAEAMGHVSRKSLAYFLAPLSLLGVVVVLGIPCAFAGLLLRADFLAPLAGLGWVLLLFCGFVMTICLLATALGWPIMWGTLATECSDSFDAVSRALAYLFQRPLHYAFYALFAAVLGGLGGIVVVWFARGTIECTYAAAEWGCGSDRVDYFRRLIAGKLLSEDPPPGYVLWLGVALISLWTGLVVSIAKAYAYSFLWSAAPGIYLLLRRDVDEKELDEVYLDDEPEIALPLELAHPAGRPASSPSASSGEAASPSVPSQPE